MMHGLQKLKFFVKIINLKFEDSGEETNEFSYVIINPSYDLVLKTGDVM